MVLLGISGVIAAATGHQHPRPGRRHVGTQVGFGAPGSGAKPYFFRWPGLLVWILPPRLSPFRGLLVTLDGEEKKDKGSSVVSREARLRGGSYAAQQPRIAQRSCRYFSLRGLLINHPPQAHGFSLLRCLPCAVRPRWFRPG